MDDSLPLILFITLPLGLILIFGGWAYNSQKTIDFGKWGFWQVVLATIHLSLASVMIGFIGDAWVTPVQFTYNKWNVTGQTCSKDSPCTIALETETVGDFETSYLCVLPFQIYGIMELGFIIVPVFSFVSGTHHLYAALSFFFNKETSDGAYYKAVQSGVNVYRWIDYAISSTLMIILLDVLFVAPPDIRTMIFVSLVQIFTIFCGYTSDLLRSKDDSKSAFRIVLVASLLYFVFFFMQGTAFYKGIDASSGAPIVVFLFVFWIFLTFSSFGICQLYYTWHEKQTEAFYNSDSRNGNTTKNRVCCMNLFQTKEQLRFRQELTYSWLSFVSKIPLLLTFYFGLASRSSNSIQVVTPFDDPPPSSGDDDITNEVVSFAVGLILALIIGLVFYCFPPKLPHKQDDTAGFY